AGSSGIAAAKALHERAIPFDCFEKSDRVYVSSKRHTIQVDFEDYLYKLQKERAAGAARVCANGFQPPVNCLPSVATAAF
ncbi:MAG TPA: hypothetical protein VH081_05315, partial [Solirubrobacteraceae bacterium]|nr:hypothetical protein [Solirubrobacteraceae bacterium]